MAVGRQTLLFAKHDHFSDPCPRALNVVSFSKSRDMIRFTFHKITVASGCRMDQKKARLQKQICDVNLRVPVRDVEDAYCPCTFVMT